MTTMTSARPYVTGGVDTHRDLHVAAALDPIGGVLGTAPFPTTAAGYRALLAWLGGFGGILSVGVEGTGSYGAALARHLTQHGVTVLEVGRPNRQVRRRHGKTDVVDAIAAARSVQSEEATATPKSHDGPVEALRALKVVQRGANKARTQALNQLHALVLTAPEELRARLRGLNRRALLLRRLPVDVEIQLLITLGSPLGYLSFARHLDSASRSFPYGRVERWINILNIYDHVPAGRGIANYFPDALDCRVDLGLAEHGATAYLEDPTCIAVMRHVLVERPETTPSTKEVEVRLTDSEALTLMGLDYARQIAASIPGSAVRDRYNAAVELTIDSFERAIKNYRRPDGSSTPAVLKAVPSDLKPLFHDRFDIERLIGAFIILATDNPVRPFWIRLDDASRRLGLARLALHAGLRRRAGEVVFDSVLEARQAFDGGFPWPRVAIAAAGLGLLALGPLGLIVVAPVGLAGGAAIVGALAAFGPGGMVGGLLAAGALAAGGAALAGAAAGDALGTAAVAADPESLTLVLIRQMADALARRRLTDIRNCDAWFAFTAIRDALGRELGRHLGISDQKAPIVVQLKAKLGLLEKAIDWMNERDLGPPELPVS